MGKDKLKRFAENETFRNLYQPDFSEVFRKDYRLKGKWRREVFGNDNPIVLELGCGRGEYTVEMARRNPCNNYIGIDIKGARLWRGAKSALEEGLVNVVFVRCRIEFVESLFGENEISSVWITFADPQIKRENKRLTSPIFLDKYAKFLINGGTVHLKTDSLFLHEYTLGIVKERGYEIIESNPDIYGTGYAGQDNMLDIKTHYEEIFLSQGLPITYMSFKISRDSLGRRTQ